MKATEIRTYREARLEEDPICPLCKKEILKEESALDHDHRTGKIRKPLHRWCNAVLGRIENWSKRGGWDNIEFLRNIVLYLESEHTDIIHPNHGRKRRKKSGRAKKKVQSKADPKRKVVRRRRKGRSIRIQK